MKVYADSPARRLRQLVADLVVLGFCAGCLWLGDAVHDEVAGLAGAPRAAGEAAATLGDNLRSAGAQVGGIPLVPGEVAAPFDGGADAADAMAAAGASTTETVEDLALYLGLALALVPALAVLGCYLPGRLRWIRTATSGRRLLDSTDDLDLFALRALARQPLHVLAGVTDDPAGAWRRGDPEVVPALARLELRDCGLEPRRPVPAGRAGA